MIITKYEWIDDSVSITYEPGDYDVDTETEVTVDEDGNVTITYKMSNARPKAQQKICNHSEYKEKYCAEISCPNYAGKYIL